MYIGIYTKFFDWFSNWCIFAENIIADTTYIQYVAQIIVQQWKQGLAHLNLLLKFTILHGIFAKVGNESIGYRNNLLLVSWACHAEPLRFHTISFLLALT